MSVLMIFGFWILVIIVNIGLDEYDSNNIRLIANIGFLILFQLLEMWKGLPFMLGIANFKNLYLQKRYFDDMEYYKDGIDEKDEYGDNMLFFKKMEYFYFDNDSKKLGNDTQFMVELELYDRVLHDRIESMKKGWKSWIIWKSLIQNAILFILIVTCL